MNKTVHVPAFSPLMACATSTSKCLGRQGRSSSWRGALPTLHHDAEYMSEPVSKIQDRLTVRVASIYAIQHRHLFSCRLNKQSGCLHYAAKFNSLLFKREYFEKQ